MDKKKYKPQFSTGPRPWAAAAVTCRENNQIEGTHAKTIESKISNFQSTNKMRGLGTKVY